MAIVSMLALAVAALPVHEVARRSMPMVVIGFPEAVLSADSLFFYVAGNGRVEVMRASDQQWVNTAAASGGACADVRGLKRFNQWLFLLCGDGVEVFDSSIPAAPMSAGRFALKAGTGVAMDIDHTRGHLWVLAEDMNFELQQYSLTGSNVWTGTSTTRLLDAINLRLPPSHMLSDLAVHIDGDMLLLTTASLTQRWDLSNTVQPQFVPGNHKYVALEGSLVVFSKVPSSGVTDVTVHTSDLTQVSSHTVPFEVVDIAVVRGVVVAAGAGGKVWFMDEASGLTVQHDVGGQVDIVKLSVSVAMGWVVAASMDEVVILSIAGVVTEVTFNGMRGVDAGSKLTGVPSGLAGIDVFKPSTGHLSAGSDIEVTCGSMVGCSVVLSVYHCPPCSAKLNGGLPTALMAAGWTPRSCAPRYHDQDTNFDQPMVSFFKSLNQGESVTLQTTLPTHSLVVFLADTQLPDQWCPVPTSTQKTLPMPPNPCLSKCATL
eukprot:TRINITY_DN4700_c0_g1_i1.p1 TRINITY_DN4700_c0_g1~~TRINITY_DN4700_c0_g1_i1.p1  ORF type:complete len:487 (+),score=140.85 TRINITY_DN4700_c0_g1_i1:46-1506(+)